jgi:hypothetical protein
LAEAAGVVAGEEAEPCSAALEAVLVHKRKTVRQVPRRLRDKVNLRNVYSKVVSIPET